MTFAVLFVCTGNICRSPMAERLFRARIDPALPVSVSSAGTHGLAGWGMDATSARVLREIGGDAEGHLARRLDEQMIRDSDLILAAESEHVQGVLQLVPAARSRVFTMREFAAFGAGAGATGATTEQALAARVELVDELRAAAPPLPGSLANIGDPYGARLSFTRDVGRLIASTVDDVIAALGAEPRERTA